MLSDSSQHINDQNHHQHGTDDLAHSSDAIADPVASTQKKNEKVKSSWREWLEAAFLAIIVVSVVRFLLFNMYTIPTSSMEGSLLVGDLVMVNKLAYGARMPITPLHFPLTHDIMPFTDDTPSYYSGWQMKYRRLPGYSKPKSGDIVVFNYPMAEDIPVDRRPFFVKRLLGTPKDTIQIVNRRLLVNGDLTKDPATLRYNYFVQTNGENISPNTREKLGITEWARIKDTMRTRVGEVYRYALSSTQLETVKRLENVIRVDTIIRPKGTYGGVFPQNQTEYRWNVDQFGPLQVPSKGDSVRLSDYNIDIYRRIITVYEGKELTVENGQFKINGEATEYYTFELNYYFMAGDNRHNSQDSRQWGFVPEDHIVGKAVMLMGSVANTAKRSETRRRSFISRLFSGDARFRWDRLFKWIE